jgi:hypothetical protein
MKGNNFISRIFGKVNSEKIEVRLDMIDFVEDGIFYTYAPALDLVGYGKSKNDAHKSFEIVLQEYIAHTISKKTLAADLQRHGWQILDQHPNPPSLTWLLENNEQVKAVYNSHDFSKSTKPVQVPLVYA